MLVVDRQMQAETARGAGPLRRIDILETVVNSAIDAGFLVVTAESAAIDCNELFLEIWNIPQAMARDNQAMMDYVLAQLVHPQAFVDLILDVNSDPTRSFVDVVELTDGRWIERRSQPCDPRHQLIHRVWWFRDRTQQVQAEAALREQQQLIREQQDHIIKMQQTALAEVSTPLIPITDHLLVMPLIGAVDTERARMILETLLEGVSSRRPQAVIIDITGVQVVDTQVANA